MAVEGECNKKATWNLEDILKGQTLEERIYRHRCVEAWSMVIPWVGFPLADFIKKCEPTSKAKFIEFTTLYDPKQMPGVRSPVLRWPYVEGLRLDEAMHPLTILTWGCTAKSCPNQNGAPLRLAVPWKYGFKHIKSIVKIKFAEKQPLNTWQESAPQEYGFYSNVNPSVDHPRWTQATERRIGEFLRRKTLMFNGYGDQVASLYAGMDLKKNYYGWAWGLDGLKIPDRVVRWVFKPVVFLASLGPFGWLVWAALTGNLSANPLSDITNETGVWTLRFICITLAITPLRKLTGWNAAIRFRRMAGLFAFFYGTLHFLTYVDRRQVRRARFPRRDARLVHGEKSRRIGRGGRLQAAVHHRRLHRVDDDGAAGADVHGRHDPPARRTAVEPAASSRLPDRDARRAALLVARQGRRPPAAHLRRRRRHPPRRADPLGAAAGHRDGAVCSAQRACALTCRSREPPSG